MQKSVLRPSSSPIYITLITLFNTVFYTPFFKFISCEKQIKKRYTYLVLIELYLVLKKGRGKYSGFSNN